MAPRREGCLASVRREPDGGLGLPRRRDGATPHREPAPSGPRQTLAELRGLGGRFAIRIRDDVVQLATFRAHRQPSNTAALADGIGVGRPDLVRLEAVLAVVGAHRLAAGTAARLKVGRDEPQILEDAIRVRRGQEGR